MPRIFGGGTASTAAEKGQRSAGLDIIRVCAIFFVIGVHFLSLNTPFKETPMTGISMFIQGMFYFLFQACIPLFLLLTGYLNANKRPERSYYRSMVRVLVSYVLFSVVTILFRKYYLGEDFTWVQWGRKILDFTAIPYGWYIDMWIGLFLLAPFLNILYRAIDSQRNKQLLLVTLFLLTALPDLCNRYGLYLVPGFWMQCYPLLFYMAGLYIREYQPRLKTSIILGLLIAICSIEPLFTMIFTPGRPLVQIIGSGSQGVFGAPMTILFFLLLYKTDIRHAMARKLIMTISLLSLDMYLCCFIFDALYYPYFKAHFFTSQSQFGIWFFVIVPLVFVSSFALAWVKERIIALLPVKSN